MERGGTVVVVAYRKKRLAISLSQNQPEVHLCAFKIRFFFFFFTVGQSQASCLPISSLYAKLS